MVRDAGHEIGLHGYSHENPVDMTLEQQRDILDYTYRMLTDFCNGKPPRGTVAPWWEVSREATELLLEYGIEYDHSMNHHDCQAYFLRTGDDWTKIDYSKKAAEWMKPFKKGKETGLVEIPANWYLDDLPPMMFVRLFGLCPCLCPCSGPGRLRMKALSPRLFAILTCRALQMKAVPNSHGWVNPRDVEDLWRVSGHFVS